MGNVFVSYENIMPLLAPQDITNAETATNYIDLRYAHRAAFLLNVGAITTATAADSVVVTVEAASAVDAAEAAVAFSYRASGVAATSNTWGAITAAAATGFVIASTDDNKSYFVEIDPQALAPNDYRYVRLALSTPDDMSNLLVAVNAFTSPRYVQTTHLSITASASA